jgi:hypothetical protein
MPDPTPHNFDLDDILDALSDPQVIFACAMSKSATTVEILRGLKSNNNHERRRITENVIRFRRSEECLFEAIAKDPVRDVRALAASSPHTPLKTLEAMLQDPSFYVRVHLAANPKTTQEMLRNLVEVGPSQVQARVAQRAEEAINPPPRRGHSVLTTDPTPTYEPVDDDIIRTLAHSDHSWIRLKIASLDLPEDLVLWLCDDPVEAVALAIACKASLPPQGLFTLARHNSSSVRKAAALHPQANEEIFRHLENDSSVSIQATVASRTTDVTLLARLATHLSRDVQTEVAGNPHTTAPTLVSLSKSRSERLRAIVARHPGAPPDLLRTLCIDGSRFVRNAARRHVAQHHNPQDLFRYCHHSPQTAPGQTWCCDDAPIDTAIELYATLDSDSVSAEVLAAGLDVRLPLRLRVNLAQAKTQPEQNLIMFAQDPLWNIRAAVASHPQIPREAAEKLLNDRSIVVRLKLLDNKRTPYDLVKMMTKDESFTIRTLAKAQLRSRPKPKPLQDLLLGQGL